MMMRQAPAIEQVAIEIVKRDLFDCGRDWRHQLHARVILRHRHDRRPMKVLVRRVCRPANKVSETTHGTSKRSGRLMMRSGSVGPI